MKCKNCIYSYQKNFVPMLCRRNAPQMCYSGGIGTLSGFPTISEDDWCGEFKKKRKEKKRKK